MVTNNIIIIYKSLVTHDNGNKQHNSKDKRKIHWKWCRSSTLFPPFNNVTLGLMDHTLHLRAVKIWIPNI